MRRRSYLSALAAGIPLSSLGSTGLSTAETQDTGSYLFEETFDELASALKPASDEYIDDSVRGWTHTPPEGWSVELAADMPQGTTEWQGWSFTTDAFWTAAAGQGRSEFTRADSVFAVADPDEWDDTDSPASEGTFDSTLVSKSIDLPDEASVYLGFASHYRQEDGQTADVVVSFDTGDEQTVLHYDGAADSDNGGDDVRNAYPVVEVSVPDGAQTMVVEWRLSNARNDWYWAIDVVRVASEPFDGGPKPGPDPIQLPDSPDGTSDEKVLVLGLDGVRWDKLRQANTPVFDRIREDGIGGPSQLYGPPLADSSSGPGWSTIATGVWPDKHGVTDNSFEGKQYDTYPDFLTLMERENPDLSTFAIMDWDPLSEQGTFSDAIDVKAPVESSLSWWDSGERIVATARDRLRNQNPDALFVYWVLVDMVGHTKSVGSDDYIEAIEQSDAWLGTLLDAIEARETRSEEDWLVVVTTDHGFEGFGHGGNTIQERTSFVYAIGDSISGQTPERQPEAVDIAHTALDHVGVTPAPGWDLDGIVLGTPSNDPFDDLKNQLKPAETVDIDSSVLGWTRTPPTGWSVGFASQMAERGTTEYRGWSFVSDEFWARRNLDGRQNFVRARDVVAVADPEKWNSGGNPIDDGFEFQTTLESSAFDVSGRETVSVEFRSHYRGTGGQIAQVFVSFDGGSQTERLRYDGSDDDTSSRTESLDVSVPAEASTMTVAWRLTASSADGFWAIDSPTIDAPQSSSE
ncbi:hypothetical protein C440_06092 [Haloferax mucosum ATCC BAA-1512]|uniref:Type I phosphodiesterase/nucleotide pyrophosphatase n=1 Tax=Haloferax mucosum ATCC BAA-1512 TaxID=662479 RepID=M0IIF7_9EURY|nr:alkaline phosphatase family protein [Haloferax mucosum]ELZ95837.1 hypothetical protein C440_06092 [Haloferax mucosum ATCC BAA-1512]